MDLRSRTLDLKIPVSTIFERHVRYMYVPSFVRLQCITINEIRLIYVITEKNRKQKQQFLTDVTMVRRRSVAQSIHMDAG